MIKKMIGIDPLIHAYIQRMAKDQSRTAADVIRDAIYQCVLTHSESQAYPSRAPTYPPLLREIGQRTRRGPDGKLCRVDEFGLISHD